MPQYIMTVSDYWMILKRRRWVILLLFPLIILLSIIYIGLQDPVYSTFSTVRMVQFKPIGGLEEMIVAGMLESVDSRIRVIKGKVVIERIVKELGLVGEDPTPQQLIVAVASLKENVIVDRIEGTNLVRISVYGNDPVMIAQIANRIAEVYIEEDLKERRKKARGVREFIEKQLATVGGRLKAAEEGQIGASMPLFKRLAELRKERDELLDRYTEMHPDVRRIVGEIGTLQEQLKNLPEPGAELESPIAPHDYELDQRLYRMFRERLEEARISEAELVSDIVIVDPAIPPKYPVRPNKPLIITFGIAVGLTVSLTSVFVVERLDTTIGTIEDIESFLKLPALGVIPYMGPKEDKRPLGRKGRFLFERLRHPRVKPKDMIATLKSQLLLYHSPRSTAYEAFRMLRTNVQIEVLGDKVKGKVVLITSAGPEEGKSIIVANLAITMAQAGNKMLLIDSDLRRSVIHKLFEFKDKEPGLTDILTGTSKVEDTIRGLADVLIGKLEIDRIIKSPGLDNLYILTSGSIVPNPAELLTSPAMSGLIEKLKGMFDIILMDSPPVLAVADPTILATKVDAPVLVYKSGKTSRNAVHRAKVQLEAVGAPCKGVILNNVSPEVEMKSTYYYHYYKYYGERARRGAKK